MQSVTSKIFMATLRMIFHSPLSDSSKLSDNAAKLTKDKKSRYKPSKNFTYTKHSIEDVKYEKIINKNCNTEKVILMIHGGGFKIELNDFYRKLAEKYSNMFCGATVINVDYGRFPEHQLPSQMYDVVKIYLHLLDKGINNSDIIVIGDSAGATLAMTSSLWLRDNNCPLPRHMIVFHGYCFKNEEFFSINTATRNYNAYPVKDIDIIMAIIRIVTGYSVGYEQILSRPIGWIDEHFADLTPLYGAKTHFVNAREYEKMWIQLPVGYIDTNQSQAIQKLYSNICSFEENKSNKNLFFALKRLNRCMLRDEEDDMAIDATIGLESLLSGGTKGEITYTISNRIPVVFKHEHSDIYKPNECRAIMKKIYNYRSVMVHGGTLKPKDEYYTINGKNIEINRIAVDFLRQTLLFVINNTEYLDAKKFDEYIDSVMTN